MGLTPGTTYHFRVVATNRTGTTTGNDVEFTTLPPPDRTGPLVGPLSPASKSVLAKKGTSLRFTLSEAGRALVTIERLQSGRQKGSRCDLRATAGRRCLKVTLAGRLVANLAAGPAKIALPGSRLSRPGRYRVTVGVTDAAMNGSVPRTVILTVR
jgi:hypothetical protein